LTISFADRLDETAALAHAVAPITTFSRRGTTPSR
jgi:hypothetical protein